MSTFEKLRDNGTISRIGDNYVLWVNGVTSIALGGFGIILTEDQEIALRENEED